MKDGKNRVRSVLRIAGSAAVVILLLLILFYAEGRRYDDYSRNNYSSYGEKEGGVKALYLSLEQYGQEAGFRVSRHMKYARFLPDDALIVCVWQDGGTLYSGSEFDDLCARVQNGQSLLFLMADGSGADFTAKTQTEITEQTRRFGSLEMLEYRFPDGGGSVYELPETDVTNEALRADNGPAADLILMIGQICAERGYGTVVFDEFYLGIQESSVADIVGIGMILACVELIVAVVLFCIRAGRRFGAPVVQASIERRSETEQMEALAGLYRRSGSAQISFTIYMEAFLQDIAKALGMTAVNPADPVDREAVTAAAKQDKRMQQLGVTELLQVYEKGSGARISARQLRAYMQKIDAIRREL